MELDCKALASQLVEIKRQILSLQQKEKQLKTQLMPFLQTDGAIDLASERVYYGEVKGSATFKRLEVLEYIKSTYGDTLAEQVDRDCTHHGKPKQTVYIKLQG